MVTFCNSIKIVSTEDQCGTLYNKMSWMYVGQGLM